MPKTMLIDATHPEETRVAVVDGNRLVEFDYESKVRKQLKSSIFLAKVTRVEPSLQAAFVNFGGNRHGFLPFSEIHPDYFRIPVSDREALLAAQIAELEEHDEMAQAELEEPEDESCPVHSDDDEEDEEIEAIVEVGGEDQPIIDEDYDGDDEEDESEETASAVDQEEDTAEEEKTRQTPIAMDVSEDVLRGPVSEDDETDENDFCPHDENSEDFSDEEDGEGDAENDHENGETSFTDAEQHSGEGEEGANGESQARRGRGRGRERGGRHGGNGRGRSRGRFGRQGSSDRDDRSVDTLGGEGVDSDRPFRFNLKRNYKIQEVIKRGQIMLIQVSKEERGNKGAAVTTYLSLPGRYCVLMPNSPRGGGVSRKIASFKERKRLKEMLDDLAVPEGMSVILRTAGVTRTKVEIKRDLDYLTRLWNTIRDHTLQSSAPALIYEEGSLIKRAIRDHYAGDIEDVVVSGGEGYKAAKEFMKMLMPSHAKKVQEYKNDRIPLFHKFGVENQIADMGEPTVNLKSGGYLVINPTEALVSVDVNSGRATKERHIEETALKTNLEAADEVARQLRLRDLGGLVVIDFIDMEDRRNNRKVENRLREALSSDRARIQVGRISSFGLLELSRQRMNPSLAESQQEVCAHCAGTGRVKTLDFSAISIVRALENEGIRGKGQDVLLTVPSSVALYILNNKRRLLADIERRYGFTVQFKCDDTLSTSQYKLETLARAAAKTPEGVSVAVSVASEGDDDLVPDMGEDSDIRSDEEDGENESGISTRDHEGDEQRNGRRRGRRGGRGRGRGRDREDGIRTEGDNIDAADSSQEDGNERAADGDKDGSGETDSPREDRANGRESGRRRRGGRGRGRGGRDHQDGETGSEGGAIQAPRSDVQPLSESKPRHEASSSASNDDHPAADVPAPSRDYEVVNQAPDKKKKGWWNKLIE